MREDSVPLTGNDSNEDLGCAFVVDHAEGMRMCGDRRRFSSSYCPLHHALCHIPNGSKAEIKRLREVEALARMVGGRRARQAGEPSRQFLEKLEQAARVSL
jgi:hypothetical protein